MPSQEPDAAVLLDRVHTADHDRAVLLGIPPIEMSAEGLAPQDLHRAGRRRAGRCDDRRFAVALASIRRGRRRRDEETYENDANEGCHINLPPAAHERLLTKAPSRAT